MVSFNMTVCKFFQQGYCRYGQNCRFEHIYGSKYSYHANPSTNVQTQQAPAPTVVTDEQLVNQVQCDIQAILKGGQWILSSYAPFKEKPGYPGLSDLSPEEARLFIYEAKAKNTVDQAVFYMNNLYKETRSKYEQLLQPTLNTIKVLRSLYRGENVSEPTFGTSNNASSIFRSAVSNPSANQNNTASIFNQNHNQNIFGQQTTDKNIFGQKADNTAAKSIFAQANNTFVPSNSASIFQTQTEPKSIFATENQKIFGLNQTQTSANPANIFASASQNIFGKVEPSVQTFAQGNIFQKPSNASNIFQQSNNTNESENAIYSKHEELSQDDMEAFKSTDFKLGFVPELPPPLSLCS